MTLGRFVTTGEEDHEFSPSPREVDAVAGPRVDAHLGHARGHHPHIAWIACGQPLYARLDPCPSLQITKAVEPGREDIGLELWMSARNLPQVVISDVAGLDPVSLVNADTVVITADALQRVAEWLA